MMNQRRFVYLVRTFFGSRQLHSEAEPIEIRPNQGGTRFYVLCSDLLIAGRPLAVEYDERDESWVVSLDWHCNSGHCPTLQQAWVAVLKIAFQQELHATKRLEAALFEQETKLEKVRLLSVQADSDLVNETVVV